MIKNFKNILLIYPPFNADWTYAGGRSMSKSMLIQPLSILYLANAVPEHNVDILDMNANTYWTMKNIKEKLINYDLIGVSCMTPVLKSVIEICNIVKECGAQTIVGGYHPTLVPSVIDEFECIDMIVRGDGEFTFKELLNGKNKKEILGLSYREDGKVHHNPDRPFVKNMDDLPYPSNDMAPSNLYNIFGVPVMAYETTRGCPFKCKFCSVTKFNKATYRKKSPERVIEELLQIPQKVKFIFLTDDNFTLIKSRVIEICELIRENDLNKRFAFICQSRVEDIANNPDMVEEMSRSGFGVFFMGIESLSQNALDRMKKKSSVENVQKAIDICHKNGIMVWGSFIIGNIGETKNDVKENIRLMKKMGIDFMLASVITAFPGTELYYEALERGWMDKNFRWECYDYGATMRTPDLTRDEIRKLNDLCYEEFYGKKRLPFFIKNFLTYMVHPKYRWSRKLLPRLFMGLVTTGVAPEVNNLAKVIGSLGNEVLLFWKKLL